MEIQAIKTQLTLATVLHYYGLRSDKNNKLNCPFHEDKTPSMQVYYKTQTAYCFSSNCKTHGKSIDVIDFILYKENSTKHEAINKAIEILGHKEPNRADRNQVNLSREQFLTNMFQYFKNAIPRLARAEISSTASAMPLARAHNDEQTIQVKTTKNRAIARFFVVFIIV